MRVEMDWQGVDRAMLFVLPAGVAVVDPLDLSEYLCHLGGREISDRVGHERGTPPLHRVGQTARPPLAELACAAFQESALQRFTGGGRLGIGHACLERLRPAREAPRTAATAALAGLLDEAILRQGLEMPRHIARALAEQLRRTTGGDLSIASHRLEEGDAQRVRKRAHGACVGDDSPPGPPIPRGRFAALAAGWRGHYRLPGCRATGGFHRAGRQSKPKTEIHQDPTGGAPGGLDRPDLLQVSMLSSPGVRRAPKVRGAVAGNSSEERWALTHDASLRDEPVSQDYLSQDVLSILLDVHPEAQLLPGGVLQGQPLALGLGFLWAPMFRLFPVFLHRAMVALRWVRGARLRPAAPSLTALIGSPGAGDKPSAQGREEAFDHLGAE